ncbi:MAG: CRISPR-associated protein Csx19 [Promethearchaeia archaeon]
MNLYACELSYVDDAEKMIQKVIADREPVPWGEIRGKWLLLHQEDGVNWGRIDDREITYSHDLFPMFSPEPEPSKLLMMRIFDMMGEMKIWSVGTGFRGRVLTDREDNTPDWGRPLNQSFVLLGDSLMKKPENGFSAIGNASGSRQVVPLTCEETDFTDEFSPLRLNVRHYFEQSPETGVVRIAASRLVDLIKEKK